MVVVLQNPHFLPTFGNVQNPLRLPRKTTSECQKVLRTREFFYSFDFEMCFAPKQRAPSQHLNFHKCSERGVLCTCWLQNVLRATTAYTFSTSQLPKVVRTWCVIIVHFDFEMGFAPQRRALFQHLNFQEWYENGVFCTCWLRNVLRATTACTFSPSQLPKVLRSWGALYILTSKCASRRNGVQFFISHLARLLRTRRFSEPTFRPSGATNHCKSTVLLDFPTFSRTWIFFLLTLSLLWSSLFFSSLLWLFPPLLFHLSILSEIWLLNFLRWPESVLLWRKFPFSIVFNPVQSLSISFSITSLWWWIPSPRVSNVSRV